MNDSPATEAIYYQGPVPLLWGGFGSYAKAYMDIRTTAYRASLPHSVLPVLVSLIPGCLSDRRYILNER